MYEKIKKGLSKTVVDNDVSHEYIMTDIKMCIQNATKLKKLVTIHSKVKQNKHLRNTPIQ